MSLFYSEILLFGKILKLPLIFFFLCFKLVKKYLFFQIAKLIKYEFIKKNTNPNVNKK
jgi:hypothetical protein